MREDRFEQRQRVRRIVPEVFRRVAHGFPGFDEGGEMHDGVDSVGAKHTFQRFPIADVFDYQLRPGVRPGVSPRFGK